MKKKYKNFPYCQKVNITIIRICINFCCISFLFYIFVPHFIINYIECSIKIVTTFKDSWDHLETKILIPKCRGHNIFWRSHGSHHQFLNVIWFDFFTKYNSSNYSIYKDKIVENSLWDIYSDIRYFILIIF